MFDKYFTLCYVILQRILANKVAFYLKQKRVFYQFKVVKQVEGPESSMTQCNDGHMGLTKGQGNQGHLG